jgi:hypothetical protein
MLCGTVGVHAATDPNVFLVNPVSNSTVTTNNLLISVKLTEPKTIKVRVWEKKQIVNGTLAAVNVSTLTDTNGSVNTSGFSEVIVDTALPFTSKNNLSFYTKQVSVSGPGLYRIEINTLDATGKTTATNNSYVIVKEKAAAEAKIFDAPQSGTMQFLQNLLKNIFGE